jgi:DNA-binding transcriptional MerR regulator
MQENHTLSTGQTAGLTGLSMQTIQRYVKRYPVGFSETARKPTKGRRFTGADVRALLLINRLLNTRRKPMIEKALRGEWSPPDQAIYEIHDLMSMYQALERVKQDTLTLLKTVRDESERYRKETGTINQKLSNQGEAIADLRFRVGNLEFSKKLQSLPDEEPTFQAYQEHKKKGLLDKLLDQLTAE